MVYFDIRSWMLIKPQIRADGHGWQCRSLIAGFWRIGLKREGRVELIRLGQWEFESAVVGGVAMG
jgi:hypothetical protein